MIQRAVIITILLLVVACNNMKQKEDYTLHDKSQLKDAFMLNSSKTFKGYFYQGSDSNYHYFTSKWIVTNDAFFKIDKHDLIVKEELPFNQNTLLMIDLCDNHSIQAFGDNQNYKLCIVSSTLPPPTK